MLRPCIYFKTLRSKCLLHLPKLFLFQSHKRNLVLLRGRRGKGQDNSLQCSSSPTRPAAPAATHMAENHGLSDGDSPVEVTQSLELLVSVIAQDVILLDGVQCLLLTLQFDNVWVWDHFLGKLPHRVFEGSREKQHLAVPGQHPARESSVIWRDPEFFTGTNGSTASPGLDGLHPREGGRGGGALWGGGRSRHGAGTGW